QCLFCADFILGGPLGARVLLPGPCPEDGLCGGPASAGGRPMRCMRPMLLVGLLGGGAGSVEDAGGGADVHVEGDAVVGVAGHAGGVGGVEFPGEQGGGAEGVAEAVPGPGAVSVGVAPAGCAVGGGQDAAVEVGGSPVLAFGAGEEEGAGVGAGGLLGECLGGSGGEVVGEGVAVGGVAWADGLAVLAVLGRLDVEVAGDLDDLAVDGDDPGGGVDLGGGEGEEFALAQAGVGGGVGHQLVVRAEAG